MLSTHNNFIQITDSLAGYFGITGPIIINLLYHFEYISIPDNHSFSGNISMVSGDDILNCDLPFEFLVNVLPVIGDVNEDGLINILDVNLIVDIIFGISSGNEFADINEDGFVNIIDILP